MIHNAMRIVEKELTNPPYHLPYVVGVAGGIPATPKHLMYTIKSIPSNVA